MRGRSYRLFDRLFPLTVVGLLALVLIGPLWEQPGLPNSADGPLHLHRSAAMARAFASGVFWPRWLPDIYGGLGAATFHYYSPLFYWLAATVHATGLTLDTATKLVLSAGFILAGLTLFSWLRRLLSVAGGIVGAALYLAQPQFFREYYFQGDYPQLLAFFLLPICLWAFTELEAESRPRTWLMASASLALLVMTHNLTAMIGIGWLVLYWVALGLYRRRLAGWLRGAAAAVLAALLSAFFWMPALGDAAFVQIGNLRQGFFHYEQYFLTWRELTSPPLVLDARAVNPPFPHMLGWAGWLAVLSGLVAALYGLFGHRRADPRVSAGIYWGVAGALLALVLVWMTTAASEWLWHILPLELLQFPSRLLFLAGLSGALAGAAAVSVWPERMQWTMTGLLLLVAIATSAVYLFPAHPFLRTTTLAPQDTQAYERESKVWGLTSGNEFLSRWADPEDVVAHAAGIVATWSDAWRWVSPHHGVGQVAEGESSWITLPLTYFPAWRALDENGFSLLAEPDENGLLQVKPEPTTRRVDLIWAGTAWQHWGERASLIGLLLWLATGFATAWTFRRRPQPSPVDPELIQANSLSIHFVRMVLLILLFAWLGRQAVVAADLGWFQRYSPPGSVTGADHPLQESLGGGHQPEVNLLGWELLSRGDLQPGDRLDVRLYWQAVQSMTVDLHSFLHLYSPERRYSWSIVQNANPGQIPTSSWPPSLYVVDDLRLDLPPDLPPATYTLAAGLVTPTGERLKTSRVGEDLVYLGEIQMTPLKAGARQRLTPAVPAPATIGDDFLLQGYDLLPAPGGPVLRLYWEVLSAPAVDYTVFVHLYNPQDERIAQYDGPPLAGMISTSSWQPGRLYVDRRQLLLPADIPSGNYAFHVGLYDSQTGQRLSIRPESTAVNLYEDSSLVVPLVVP